MAITLTDAQWERIRGHFPEENIPGGRPGRKPVPTRRVLEAVLWILNTGAQWHMLPQCYPNYKTVHRRFQRWCEREGLRRGRGGWPHQARKRRENHGDRGPAWPPPSSQHPRGQPPRGHPRAADVRLLDDRGEAREPDRRQGPRQRRPGRGAS